jgi:hypothetical protein
MRNNDCFNMKRMYVTLTRIQPAQNAKSRLLDVLNFKLTFTNSAMSLLMTSFMVAMLATLTIVF